MHCALFITDSEVKRQGDFRGWNLVQASQTMGTKLCKIDHSGESCQVTMDLAAQVARACTPPLKLHAYLPVTVMFYTRL